MGGAHVRPLGPRRQAAGHMRIPPLALIPDLRRRPWGGDRLRGRWPASRVRLEPGPAPVGEAWLAGPASRVAGGDWAGRTLAEIAAEGGAAFVGTAPFAAHGACMPLLVKLLDAAEPLSVQVHPDDAAARQASAGAETMGKTEAWWVLEAYSGAVVWWGFRHPVAPEAVRAAIAAGALTSLLRQLPAHADDVIVNPAGTVHALGAGLLVYEVQQASDRTYRLDDHGRVGADGRPRELHLAQGLAVATLVPGDDPAPPPREVALGRRELARTHAFVLERVDAAATPGWTVTAASLEVLTHVAGGPVHVHGDRGSVTVAPHATWVFGAGSGTLAVEGGGVLARARYPG